MPFNFFNGNGEYQFKHRPLRCGDIFSILGTNKEHKYLLLGDPRIEENTPVTFINQVDKILKRKYFLDTFAIHLQKKMEFPVSEDDCYRLVASTEDLTSPENVVE